MPLSARSGVPADRPAASSLRSLVAEVLEIRAEDISDDLGPATFGRWTSLKHIELVAAVEHAYGIRFSPREIRSFSTFGELLGIVSGKGP
jgi:acyl carrier protein